MAPARPSSQSLALVVLTGIATVGCSGKVPRGEDREQPAHIVGDTREPAPAGAAVKGVEGGGDAHARSAPIVEAPRERAPSTAGDGSAGTVAAKASTPVGDRIYSKGRFAWIQAEPRRSPGWLGYLGLGGSVAVRGGNLEKARVPNAGGRDGCKEWYAVEPIGYVCTGDSATTDPADPVVVALAADAPRTDSPWPYEYGESLGAPRYAGVPTADQQQHDEWDLKDHLRFADLVRRGDPAKELAGVDLSPAAPSRWGPVPDPASLHEQSPLVRESRKWIATGSTVAYTRSFDLGGRTFLVTHDHAIVPKDRVKPYPRSEFHGVELGAQAALPLAFFRQHDAAQYRREADGTFTATGASWPRLAWVALTGVEVKDGKRTLLETRDALWVLESEAAVARAAEGPPAVVRAIGSARKTWLDVSVLGGTLVAYEDDKPVFATLISPGRGGIPATGKDPLETASTPLGTFRVDGKFVTATMVSSTNDLLVHTEVQYVQNFHGPHALHGAYWHDGWGEKKSGGCVNLAPIDARRLFGWTEPRVPDDWYGMRSVKEMGPATVVVVHR